MLGTDAELVEVLVRRCFCSPTPVRPVALVHAISSYRGDLGATRGWREWD